MGEKVKTAVLSKSAVFTVNFLQRVHGLSAEENPVLT